MDETGDLPLSFVSSRKRKALENAVPQTASGIVKISFFVSFQAAGRAAFARSRLPFAECFNVISAELGLKRAFVHAASAARNVAPFAGKINSADCALGVLQNAERPVRLLCRFSQPVYAELHLLYRAGSCGLSGRSLDAEIFRCPRDF